MKQHSLGRRLVLWIIFIIIPITIFIIFENLYAINVVRNQVSKSNQGTLSLYVEQIEESLSGAENYLANLTYNNEIITSASAGEDEYERYMQSQLLLTEVSSAKLVYPQIDGFFVVSREDQRIIKKSNGSEKLENLEEMRYYLMDLTQLSNEDFSKFKGQWYGKRLKDDHYLFRIYRTDEYVIGAWVNIDNLLMPLKLSEFGEDKLFAISSVSEGVYSSEAAFDFDHSDHTTNLNTYQIVGTTDRYILISEVFKQKDLSLIALIPDRGILDGLDTLQISITIMSFLIILVLPMTIYLINRSVIRPLGAIVEAMNSAHQGNMDIEIVDVPDYREYTVVRTTFKDMLKEIKNLKIDVYEEQLLKQKAQLQYYQLQINPHFIMNALNLIYGLAENKKFSVIQDMTLSLVAYFRSLLSITKEVVITVEQEINHVENYLKIQQLRYPDHIDYEIIMDPELEESHIPPMIIQGLVENAIKHASDPEKILEIKIQAIKMETYIQIIVKDNGEGFDGFFVDALNQWQSKRPELKRVLKDHVGIMNIMERLSMIYSDLCTMFFANRKSGGARIQINLPLTFSQDPQEVSVDV